MISTADILRSRIDTLPHDAGAFFRRRLDALLMSYATDDEVDALARRFEEQVEAAAAVAGWR